LYKCVKQEMNPFSRKREILKFWEGINAASKEFWKAPDRLFWICGEKAYIILPGGWKGCCTLGIIQPGFFLLPLESGDELGIPV
ncbi:ENR1 protein, partial [Campylorhamphus procurvoides]|nr:ENR1 protein [Campylorhamphus procurvoides]